MKLRNGWKMQKIKCMLHSKDQTINKKFSMLSRLICFGTACLFGGRRRRVVKFSSRHIKEFYIQENKKGVVDTFIEDLNYLHILL